MTKREKMLLLVIVVFATMTVIGGVRANTPGSLYDAQLGAAQAHYPIAKIKGCQVTCGTTHTSIACTSPGFTVRSRAICNTSDTDIYVSDSAVTSSSGALLKVGMCAPTLPDSQAGGLDAQCAVSGGGKALSVWEGG